MKCDKISMVVFAGMVSGACVLPASAGWLDAVKKVVDTAVSVTNSVESARNSSQGTETDDKASAKASTAQNTAAAEPVGASKTATAAKTEATEKTETKTVTETVTKTETKSEAKPVAAKTSSRTALSEEEADDIANGQPISMDMDDLAARMKASSDYVLIDVRKPMEFKTGHIKGAKNVPFDDVSNSMSKPCDDKDKPIYLYCLSGDRAIAAGQYLIKNGYKRVYNCGSIDDWSGKLVK